MNKLKINCMKFETFNEWKWQNGGKLHRNIQTQVNS
jgi:hypothetical protein